jgi:hypothetical protein
MGHEQQRRAAFAVQLEQEVDHLAAGRRVQVAGRLVREQQLRPGHEGARDRDALLLAARELLGIVVHAVGKAHSRQHRARIRLRAHGAGKLERKHHVFQSGHRRQELERLEHEADHAPAQRGAPVFVEREQVVAVDPHRSGARRVEPRQQPEQRRLSRSGHADDCDRLSHADLETNVRENGQFRIAGGNLLAQSGGLDDGLCQAAIQHRGVFGGCVRACVARGRSGRNHTGLR